MLKYALAVYTLIGWYSDDIMIRFIYVLWICALLMHWLSRNNECSLIYIESIIRGKPKEETYMHKNLTPFFELDKLM